MKADVVPYEDAIDLLDADHKAVKKMFIDYAALVEDAGPAAARRPLAERICQEITIHAQIEEEIFYPAVREAVDDDSLMDHALEEHAEAKELIARIQDMKTADDAYDETVQQLAKAIDGHVREEREQIFLRARHSALDLRGLAVPLFRRKKELHDSPTKLPKPARSAKGGKAPKSKVPA